MRNKSSLIGKQFRQNSLPGDLQGQEFGQPLSCKFIIVSVCLLFLFLSSGLSGLIGTTLIIFIIFPTQAFGLYINLYTTLTAAIWVYFTAKSGFSNGLHAFSACLLGSFVLSFFLFTYSFISSLASFEPKLFITIPLGIVFMSSCIFGAFILMVYSLMLNRVVLQEFKDRRKYEYFIVVIASALLSCITVLIDLENSQYNSHFQHSAFFFDLRAAFVVFTVAVCATLLSLSQRIVKGIEGRYRHFAFLKAWSVILSTWHGTSFRNLDLSGINFRGAKLANVDFRASKLYRTCLKDAIGLDKARVDNHYIDLDKPKVQQLLTQYTGADFNYRQVVLRGAYLREIDIRQADFSNADLTGVDFEGADLRACQFNCSQLAGASLRDADLRKADLTDANLTGADCRGADFRGAILTRAQIAGADFTGGSLTGACIEDWSISSSTSFKNVLCSHIYKLFRDGQFVGRYPRDRNFDTEEFSALFQKPDNILELAFKGDFSHAALSLAIEKLEITEPDLNLKIRGIEQREKLWVVTCFSTHPTIEIYLANSLIETSQARLDGVDLNTAIKGSVYQAYEEMKLRLQESQIQINKLIGINETQAETVNRLSRKEFSTNFFILGGKITNLVGQGSIEYTEAAHQVRELVTNEQHRDTISTKLKALLSEIEARNTVSTANVSTTYTSTANIQTELLQQVMLREIEADPDFRKSFLSNAHNILTTVPYGIMATAVRAVLSTLET